MKALLVIFSAVAMLGLSSSGQIYENYHHNQQKAFAADSVAEWQSSLQFCNEVLTINPNHPVMNYLAARLNEQLGNRDIALKYLRKAAKLGYTSSNRWLTIHPVNDPVFNDLRKSVEFEIICEFMKVSDQPVHKSQIAFTILDKDIRPEGITYDPVESVYYLGCTDGIIRVDQSGKHSVFTREGQKKGCWYNGIHVDPINRSLWACSTDKNGDHVNILKYDLSSGKLVKKYQASSDGSRHFFNDLVIHPNGDVYISGTALYRISRNSDTMELLLRMGSNGITLSGDGRVIYAATNVGIYKIAVKTKAVTLLAHGEEFHTYGIDGLYCSDDYLYAIQNELITQVGRFKLNEDATHLVDYEIFEKNTDDLRAPTTGVIVDGCFHFIADTQGKGSKFKGVVVMKACLE